MADIAQIKACKDCLVVQPADQFPKHSGGRGYRARCRKCHNAREASNRRNNRLANPETYQRELDRNKDYRSKYGEGYKNHRIKKRQKHVSRYYSDLTFRCGQMISAAKRRADKKGFAFEIDAETLEAVIKSQDFKCRVTGITFDLSQSAKYLRSPLGPSLDRKNSDLGYTWDNVQVVVTWYNMFKNEWSDEDVRGFIDVAYHSMFKA